MKPTKQSHSNNPIATTNFKKGEIVAITEGIYQGQTGEIFDEIFIANKKAYEIIIGGCFPVFIFDEFLSPIALKNDQKEEKPDRQQKGQSKSGNGGQKQVRASK